MTLHPSARSSIWIGPTSPVGGWRHLGRPPLSEARRRELEADLASIDAMLSAPTEGPPAARQRMVDHLLDRRLRIMWELEDGSR